MYLCYRTFQLVFSSGPFDTIRGPSDMGTNIKWTVIKMLVGHFKNNFNALKNAIKALGKNQ